MIVAGGIGTRMQSAIPKQFLLLNGIPILMHTINAFLRYSSSIEVIVVLPSNEIEHWKQLCEEHNFTIDHQLVDGGDTRFQSVKNGLQEIKTPGLVAIHDGVRPLVSTDIIGASFRLASIHRSAIASVRLKESIRVVDQDTTTAVDRSFYRMIQTPQTFETELIKASYQIKEQKFLTDDASVAEKAGNKISLFEGSYDNIKITTPEDLTVATALLKQQKKANS